MYSIVMILRCVMLLTNFSPNFMNMFTTMLMLGHSVLGMSDAKINPLIFVCLFLPSHFCGGTKVFQTVLLRNNNKYVVTITRFFLPWTNTKHLPPRFSNVMPLLILT